MRQAQWHGRRAHSRVHRSPATLCHSDPPKSVKWLEKLPGKTGLNILRKSFGVILLAIAIKLFRSNTHL
ncbi:MAG TPA: hypothetical protein DCO83_06380 [Mucilaginibacter sp.]|nr:hypothetical protein [Mucilaginibacter sp.]